MAPSSFDRVNEAYNNVFFSIPIVSKPGRGMPFTSSLVYNSSIWTGGSAWTPASGWGWAGMSSANAGSLYATWWQGTCTDFLGIQYFWDEWTFLQYYDPTGGVSTVIFGPRWYGVTVSDYNQSMADCTDPDGWPATATATLGDGSGYTLVFNPGGGSYGTLPTLVYAPSGTQGLAFPQGTNLYGLSTGVTDTNNNSQHYTVDANGNPTYTDTLGATVLTATSGPGSNTYTYTAPDGSSQHYTVNYTQKYVRTNFGCSGVSEYGPTTQYLVSEIDLPDDTPSVHDRYTFTYEATPGYPGTLPVAWPMSPSQPAVRYPTRTREGTTTRAFCAADGSTATLTRTLNPGGGGARRRGATRAPKTAVPHGRPPSPIPPRTRRSCRSCAPPTNLLTVNFVETKRQVYSGSSTLLATVDTCYNGAIPCSGTISLPITSRTVQTTGPNPSRRPTPRTTALPCPPL